MSSQSESDLLVRAVVVGVLLFSALGLGLWWHMRAQEREARGGALPGCITRLGSAGACESRFDDHHRDCFNATNKPASKFGPRAFDAEGYLDCIVQGRDAWARARRDANDQRRARDRADGIPER